MESIINNNRTAFQQFCHNWFDSLDQSWWITAEKIALWITSIVLVPPILIPTGWALWNHCNGSHDVKTEEMSPAVEPASPLASEPQQPSLPAEGIESPTSVSPLASESKPPLSPEVIPQSPMSASPSHSESMLSPSSKDMQMEIPTTPQPEAAQVGRLLPRVANNMMFFIAMEAQNADLSSIHLAVEGNGDVFRQQDKRGNTPVMWAIANANNGTAMALLNAAIGYQVPSAYLDIRADSYFSGNTALHLALGKGYNSNSMHGDVLRYTNNELAVRMIELGADVTIANEDGNTPLHLACLHRNVKMIEYLTEHGASMTVKNNKNESPQDFLKKSYEEAAVILKNTVGAFLLDEKRFPERLPKSDI